MNQDELLTVGQLIEALKHYDPSLPIIYSHDDEGNEFQTVNGLPSGLRVKNWKNGRFLEVETPSTESPQINAVCIN